MPDAESSGRTEREELVGFFDADGKWVTMAEAEQKLGDRLDTDVRTAVEELADIDIMNVRRNPAGEIVTAQLSQFAVDLYELPKDADVDQRVAVYVEHNQEPPEELREEYLEKLRRKRDAR